MAGTSEPASKRPSALGGGSSSAADRETPSQQSEAVSATRPHSLPPPSRGPVPSRRFNPNEWTRYENVEFVGAGGMGRVFKATDPRLHRVVALKFLRDNEPEYVRRLLREAKAQASIDHPNICKVYEVGEFDGQSYIAMQFIVGKSLRAMRHDLSIDAKVEIMRKVADAMHAAHRLGVIHRDLKPANIMLESGDDGSYRPYIMDFGLAHIAQDTAHSRSGLIEGTPAYMSPEQAQGQTSQLDRRTDVYSLGATLYEILVDKPPFAGAHTLEIIMKVLNEEPAPLRELNPHMPEDLEAIVMKCLEKEVERRYDSAKALAEDLRRYLDGEPVQARMASLGYRLLKKARKHKALVAISSALLVSVIALAGVGVRAEVRAREQARLAQQLGQDVERIESFLRFAYSMPVHDIGPEKEAVRGRMRGIESAMAAVGLLGEGSGHYALGRGHLALHEYEQALSHLEGSAKAGYKEPELEQATGLALGGLYGRELDQAQRIADKDAREARRKEIEQKYLVPALEHIRKGRGAATGAPAYSDALIAFYEKRYEDAGKLAHEAAGQSPWLYEASKLEGDAYFELGSDKKDRGEDEAAQSDYARASAAYQRAADVARSDGEVQEALAEVWIAVMDVQSNRGKDPAEAFKNAIDACDRALTVNPASANAFSKKSRAHWFAGQRASATGADPRPAFQKAISYGQEAVRLSPHDAITFDSIGNAATYVGVYEDEHGLDPRASFDLAIGAFQRSIDENPAFAWAWNDMGTAYDMKADYEARRGLDSRPTRERAIELYKHAIEVEPSYVYPYSNMGFAYAVLALSDAERGVDSRSVAKLGIDACRAASERNKSSGGALINMGHAQLAIALYELVSGLDPRRTLAETIDTNQRAIHIRPLSVEAHQNITQAHRFELLYALSQSADATEALSKAREASRKMLELDPNASRSNLLAGQVELAAARLAIQNGREPEEALRAADVAFHKATKLNPRSPENHEANAELSYVTAEYQRQRGKPLEDIVEKGLTAAEQALAINPRFQRAIAFRGALYLVQARSERDRAKAAADAKLAEAALSDALKDNPALEREMGKLREDARSLAKSPP